MSRSRDTEKKINPYDFSKSWEYTPFFIKTTRENAYFNDNYTSLFAIPKQISEEKDFLELTPSQKLNKIRKEHCEQDPIMICAALKLLYNIDTGMDINSAGNYLYTRFVASYYFAYWETKGWIEFNEDRSIKNILTPLDSSYIPPEIEKRVQKAATLSSTEIDEDSVRRFFNKKYPTTYNKRQITTIRLAVLTFIDIEQLYKEMYEYIRDYRNDAVNRVDEKFDERGNYLSNKNKDLEDEIAKCNTSYHDEKSKLEQKKPQLLKRRIKIKSELSAVDSKAAETRTKTVQRFEKELGLRRYYSEIDVEEKTRTYRNRLYEKYSGKSSKAAKLAEVLPTIYKLARIQTGASTKLRTLEQIERDIGESKTKVNDFLLDMQKLEKRKNKLEDLIVKKPKDMCAFITKDTLVNDWGIDKELIKEF